MLEDVVRFLICPYCGTDLAGGERTLRCRAGHTFDVARQGYVSLLPGGSRAAGSGDTAAMVAAREAFLGEGHYAPLARYLARHAADAVGEIADHGCVVDVGAGTGYYLAEVLAGLPARGGQAPAGVALDVSKHALRRAARAHPRIGAVACDVWTGLPVRSGCAYLVLNVFAPRNGAELRRVLRDRGRLVVVTPTVRHLAELVPRLGLLSVDGRKKERVAQQLGPYFDLVDRHQVEYKMRLTHADVHALVTMGPSAWHTDPDATQARIAELPEPFEVTASVAVAGYRGKLGRHVPPTAPRRRGGPERSHRPGRSHRPA